MTNTEIPRDLLDAAMDLSNAWGDVRDDYSGRGMYGDTCFGVEFEERGGSTAFFIALGMLVARNEESNEFGDDVDEDLAFRLAKAERTDSMGLGTITYFPGFVVAD